MPLVGWFVLFAVAIVAIALLTRDGGRTLRAPRPLRSLVAAVLWRSRSSADTQKLLDALDDAVIAVDAQGVILAANRAAAQILCPDRPFTDALFDEALLMDLLCGDDEPLGPTLSEELMQWWSTVVGQMGRVEDHPMFMVESGLATDVAIGLEVLEVAGTLGAPRVILRVHQGSVRAGRVGVARPGGFVRVFDSSPQPMAIFDLRDGVITEANGALVTMLTGSQSTGVCEPVIGRRLREFTHPQDVGDFSDLMARLELGSIEDFRTEQRLRRADGEFRVAEVRVHRINQREVAVHLSDLTEQRAAARHLSYRDRHDALTGLLNRGSIVDILEELVTEAAADTIAVVHVDLDNFKQVNDSIGHALGDVVVQQVAARLQEVTLGSDQLARLGADEFVICLDGGGARVDARAAADRAMRSIQEALIIHTPEEVEIFLSASIGYVVSTGVESAEDLLAAAEAAMQHAKSLGRDTIVNWRQVADGVAGSAGSALRITSELRRGIQRGELLPFFQPILSLRSGRVTGYEVLARWQHPERGLLGPGEFMAQAEDSGVMVELGAAMLRGALLQLRQWRAESREFDRRTVSVNVATRQLTDPSFYHSMVDILEEVGIGGESLWLEITETSLLSDVKGVMAALTDLRGLGIRLAVDDFGTGYSSLTYLKRFPVEAIKIDRSFVSGLGHNDDDSAIVDAVVRLGAALNLTVVAEGVETKEQARALQALGCDRGQGYLFGRPVAASAVSRI
jgi:diguanylate cyclase (GGDEF)-like protein/PAS domain S-box-containing protein